MSRALDANQVRQAFEQATQHGLAGMPRLNPGAFERHISGTYKLDGVQWAWLGYLERASEQHTRTQAPLTEGDRAEVRSILIRHIIGDAETDDSIDKLAHAILNHFAP
jgi:hypothetical protein